jgi:hypothetical protein
VPRGTPIVVAVAPAPVAVVPPVEQRRDVDAAAETTTVPAIVGMAVERARQALRGSRLEVGIVGNQETRTAHEGVVLAQSRAAGTTVTIGSAVDLVVATPQVVTVPNVIGLTSADAAAAIARAGLPVGPVERRLSTDTGGTVLAQSPPAGVAIAFTTPVGVQVARSRLLWAAPAGLLLVGVAMLLVRRIRDGRGSNQPRTSTGLPVDVQPHLDDGEQQMTMTAPLVSLEVRLRAVADSGTQRMQPERGVIAEEGRRHG